MHKTTAMLHLRVLIGSALLASSLTILSGVSAIANEKFSEAEKAVAIQKFRDAVKKNTFEACNKSVKINSRLDREIACSCYSERYVNKYSDNALVNIVSWMNKNPSKTSIVIQMLEPERKICKIP